jgi:hypothetical protein
MITLGIVNECLIVHFTDYEMFGDGAWQAGSAFHNKPRESIGKSVSVLVLFAAQVNSKTQIGPI